MTEYVTSADGTRIAHQVAGDSGPAVVIVDGALCHRAFGPSGGLAAELAGAHRVFSYDRRGRGESGAGGPYAVEREVEDLAAVVAAAGGRATLLGLSSGAALALRAAGAGIGVERVVAYEPPFSTSEEQRARFAEYRAGVEKDVLAGEPGDAVARFMLFVGSPGPMVEQLRQSPVWPAFVAVAPTLVNDAEVLDGAAGAPVPTALLAGLPVPVLVADGELSPAMLRDAATATAAAAGAEYRTLAGQTHEVAPEVLGPVVAEFVARG
ncbi:alpha/beta fold hydrolase [Kitasatospora cineracea]|uniref:Pimeloyl-ACP methyl ester carboxylesterase n=1 Tax=Kitasatospora cineracea TaxID=88074 RepID=A0A3N4SBW7_9ACTN|nr:alpha/beta fold hydrolase [Kitasatospora cineracea]RPE33904.1 pimeloyl-ACP methyl ester carboxylesterase [Kitasatospora cineracea]